MNKKKRTKKFTWVLKGDVELAQVSYIVRRILWRHI